MILNLLLHIQFKTSSKFLIKNIELWFLIRVFREIFQLMNKYESMVIEIQSEAKHFRDESKKLKENLAAIILENNRLKEFSSHGNSVAAFRSEYILVADKIFTNLRNQLYLVNQVRETLSWKLLKVLKF